MQKVLVVEDEIKTQTYIKLGLSENGFEVELESNGSAALQLILNSKYDLVIMDVMLPGLSGWEIIREIKKRGISTPVIFLTANDLVEDRVKGLDLGASDYLVKPFAFAELLARIRATLRKENFFPMTLKIADLEIDPINQRAVRASQLLDLTSKEFKILLLLAQKQGEIVPRSMIASSVWNIHFDTGTNIVEVHVRRLRAKMDDQFSPKLIHTVKGLGYTLREK